jgi:hypothetical protein
VRFKLQLLSEKATWRELWAGRKSRAEFAFAELDQSQAKLIKDKENLIPKNVISFISTFDSRLTNGEIESDRFAYRLLFVKVLAKRKGQADRVIEFIDPKFDFAKNVAKEYWV